jgi:DNA primase
VTALVFFAIGGVLAMLIRAQLATSGTAFTEGHITQLMRYTDTLHFAFDADAAGFKATVAATQTALAAGMKVATIVLPSGKDPADLVRESPAQAKEAAAKVQPLLAVLMNQLHQHGQEQEKEGQLQALLPLLALVKNPIQQGNMIEATAQALHVPSDRIISLLNTQASSALPASTFPQLDQPLNRIAARPEKALLGLLIEYPQVRQALFSYLEPELFLDHQCVTLYKSMQQLAEDNSAFFSLSAGELIDAIDERQRSFAEGLRALAGEGLAAANQDPLPEGRALVRSLRRRSLKGLLEQLQAEVSQSNDHQRLAILERFRAISQELASIDNS